MGVNQKSIKCSLCLNYHHLATTPSCFQLELTYFLFQLELQRQQLIQERQAFYKELVKVKHGGVVNFPSPPAAEPVQSVPVSTPGTPVTSTTGAPPHYAPQHHYVGPPPGGMQVSYITNYTPSSV